MTLWETDLAVCFTNSSLLEPERDEEDVRAVSSLCILN